MGKYRRRHEILQEFTKIMFQHDILAIAGKENPKAETEYEAEALSVLSRFTEGALHLCEDESLRREIAVNTVRQAYEFWFSMSEFEGIEKLAFELLDCFLGSYPTPEQAKAEEVQSET